MGHCKRMTVSAVGYRGDLMARATNYNETECTNVPGQCGCKHAEVALLEKINPFVLWISHSPCLNCAKELLKSDVKEIYYYEEYRIKDGIELLRKNGIEVIHVV